LINTVAAKTLGGKFIMSATVEPVQQNWRWCRKCEGAFYAGGSIGRCPAGGVHDSLGSGYYLMRFASPGQANWRRCRKCEGIFFNGNSTAGRCPVGGTGAGHEPDMTINFYIDLNNSFGKIGTQPDWKWCVRCEGMFFAGNTMRGRCTVGGSHDGSRSGNYNLPVIGS